MPKKFEGEEWIGMMILPRLIKVIDENVYFTIPDYIQNLFTKEIQVNQFNIDIPCRIRAKLTSEGKINIGGFKIYVADDKIVANRSNIFFDCDLKAVEFKSPKLNGIYDLDIYR